MKKKWRCAVCGHIHEGEEAPNTCPKCGAEREEFGEMTNNIKIVDDIVEEDIS